MIIYCVCPPVIADVDLITYSREYEYVHFYFNRNTERYFTASVMATEKEAQKLLEMIVYAIAKSKVVQIDFNKMLNELRGGRE